MKKLILSLIILMFGFLSTSKAQNQTTTQLDWRVENQNEWGSFYWAVTKEIQPDSLGRYFYYVYFYSNSLFHTKADNVNYDKASTYIRGINLYMYEYKIDGTLYNTVPLSIEYYTCDYHYDPKYYVAYFWSYSPYNNFSLTFQKASAFDYSIY